MLQSSTLCLFSIRIKHFCLIFEFFIFIGKIEFFVGNLEFIIESFELIIGNRANSTWFPIKNSKSSIKK